MKAAEATLGAQAALTLDTSGEGVAWLVFDRPDHRLNLLTSAVMTRLDALLATIETEAAAGTIRAVIVRSGKEGTFIAGADINEILEIDTAAAGETAARAGQRIFRRLERLPVPTVAAIDGVCLGGATELILACGHRIASERAETRIGLPEVQLGILPGFGGTTRLPRLIGLKEALPLILGGRPVSVKRAQRMGLVDETVPAAALYERARVMALAAAAEGVAAGRGRRRRARPLLARLLEDSAPGRKILFSRARKQVLAETRGHYPAPLVALDVIARSAGAPLDRAFDIEARALGQLIATPVSKNLVHVFELMDAAKKASPPGARPIARAGVVGAGVMGGGIAQLLAAHEIDVRMKDIRADAITQGLRHARERFESAVRRGRMPRQDIERRMNRIAPTLEYSGFGGLELVVEAVIERMDVKQRVLREVESRVKPGCVLASNTSSLSITAMQAALERPADFCGMHFFNPVHRMPLVEVIRGAQTSDEAIATTFGLALTLGKTPVIVNDGPGFLVNRILAPYLNEAVWLLAEGASINEIDDALLDFGMPMGPFRLLDEIGLDVASHVAQVMYEAFGERMRPAPPLAALSGTDLLGKKGGRGFYSYAGEKQTGPNHDLPSKLGIAASAEREDIARDVIRARTVLVMVNEAARILDDGIVRGPGDVDLGMITGTGFPPFRGGLLRHADSMGITTVLSRLEAFTRAHGQRFEPAPMLRELAANGRGFYT